MERLTYFDNGKWRLKISDTEYSGNAVDRLAAYEDTGLEPEEIDKFKKDIKKIKDDVDSLFEKQAFLNFLESKGIDTNIGVNWMCDVFDMLHDKKNNEIISINRLRELVQADRDGRCIIPPAKIGDTIYHITTCKDFPQMLDGTMYDADGGYGTATGLYCPCELMENCPFSCDDDGGFDCDKHKNTLAIFEGIVDSIHIEDMENYITFNYSGGADFEDFGKTVFLTREEAEKALRRKQNGEEC